jgi:IMP dehydrogenase
VYQGISFQKAYAFDDVLCVPDYTYVQSRDNVDLTTELFGYTFRLPFLSANMSSVTGENMMVALYTAGGLGVLHRMMPAEQQASIIRKVLKRTFEDAPIAFSFGVKTQERERVYLSVHAGGNIGVLDVAFAASDQAADMIYWFLNEFDLPLIIGNVATYDNISQLLTSIDPAFHRRIAFKVGVGSGSLCTTRIKTGCGLPTLASLFDCQGVKVPLIADGGMKSSGDVVKALAAGAKMVMLGSLFAGTDEAPGDIYELSGDLYKSYRGSASYADKALRGTETRYIEGMSSSVPYVGSVHHVINDLSDGVRSGVSYLGFDKLPLHGVEFAEVSANGHKESTAHLLR